MITSINQMQLNRLMSIAGKHKTSIDEVLVYVQDNYNKLPLYKMGHPDMVQIDVPYGFSIHDVAACVNRIPETIKVPYEDYGKFLHWLWCQFPGEDEFDFEEHLIHDKNFALVTYKAKPKLMNPIITNITLNYKARFNRHYFMYLKKYWRYMRYG